MIFFFFFFCSYELKGDVNNSIEKGESKTTIKENELGRKMIDTNRMSDPKTDKDRKKKAVKRDHEKDENESENDEHKIRKKSKKDNNLTVNDKDKYETVNDHRKYKKNITKNLIYANECDSDAIYDQDTDDAEH